MSDSIADLVATTPAPGPAPTMDIGAMTGADKITGLTDQLADLQRGHVGKQTQIMGETEQRTQKAADQAQQMFDRAYNEPGVGPNALKPWDEQEASAKYATDPIESFGSLGSIFAILASAFTHAPMENALNGAASAMNAIKQGNDEAYKRAYTAWKDNTDLAMKRHQMMHTAYQDATQLLTTNMALGEQKLKNEAVKFGDQKMLMLLEAGMNKEVFELVESRQKLATGMMEAQIKMADDFNSIGRMMELGFDPKNPGSAPSREAYKQFRAEKVEQQKAEDYKFQEQERHTKAIEELTRMERDRQITEAQRRQRETEERERHQRKMEELTGQRIVAADKKVQDKAKAASDQRKAVVDDYVGLIDQTLVQIASAEQSKWPSVGMLGGITNLKQKLTGDTSVDDLQRSIAELKTHYGEVFQKKGRNLAADDRRQDQIIPGEIRGFNLSTKGIGTPSFAKVQNLKNALIELRGRIKTRYNELIQPEDAPTETGAAPPAAGGAATDALPGVDEAAIRAELARRGVTIP